MTNGGTTTIITLAAPDPIFALCPGLPARCDDDGELVTNSRDIAKYFGQRHRRVIKKILDESWHAPLRPPAPFRFRADETIDLNAEGLVMVMMSVRWRWGKGRGDDFLDGFIELICRCTKDYAVRTGDRARFDLGRMLGIATYVRDDDGEMQRLCDDCRWPKDAGPMLRDEVWATIAKPGAYLCFACIESRLARPLTQADLTPCPFNAGWLPYATIDPAAAQFAIGRTLLQR